MRPQPLVAARIDFSGEVPRSVDYGDIYHPIRGAREQLEQVFLRHNGLPGAWRGRRRFAILETGFGLGHNFLGTWAAWRQDESRSQWLEYVSLELHPPSVDDLRRVHLDAAACEEDRARAEHLIDAWPPLTAGLHRLRLDGQRVSLTLGFGDARELLPALVGHFDAFFLDGFDPRRNPTMWDERLLRNLSRLAAPQATAATWSVSGAVRRALSTAGFSVERTRHDPALDADRGDGPRPGRSKRQTLRARFDPVFQPRAPAGRPGAARPSRREALIVGAGLAGASVAAELAGHGWACTVLEAADAPAAGASGNPAGLFHGALHSPESLHARLHRAGALLSARRFRPLIDAGTVPGAIEGLLSVRLDGEAWPPSSADYACGLNEAQTRRAAGRHLDAAALLYADGGWISPAHWVRWALAQPGVRLQLGARVDWIEAPPQDGGDWRVGDAQGRCLGQAPVLVLAGGAQLPALARAVGMAMPATIVTRGQLQWFASPQVLRLPVSGHGYALRLPGADLVFGAASIADEAAVAPLEASTRWNLQRLKRLTGIEAPSSDAGPGATREAAIHCRVSHRLGTRDRLPLIGPVPDLRAVAKAGPQDQVRRVPRREGLFVVGGFGSRGLSWAPLAAEIVLGWLEGMSMPLEADLLDAVDPAREWVRLQRSLR